MICLQKKTKEVLALIIAHYQSLDNDVRAQIQLEHDLEQETIKKASQPFPIYNKVWWNSLGMSKWS